ncbi:MAG: rhodanese-like domain-containing protein [Caldilineaceae bacterium]
MRISNSEELKAKLDRGDNLKLVMTLNEWAYRAKHIPGSIYVASQEQVPGLLQLDDEIIVYCTNPACSASIIAYEALRAQGFTNVARYPGGIQEWEEAGYPVVSEYQNNKREETSHA